MMVQPKRESPKISTSSDGQPKEPHPKTHTPFENPLPKCKKEFCPNYSNGICGLCNFHCKKEHDGKHYKSRSEEIDNLVNKYLKDESNESKKDL